jgi:hypothetical protein
MGSVFKKAVTRPLPPGAEVVEQTRKVTTRRADGTKVMEEVVERVARWRDGRERLRTCPVTTGRDGAVRLREESGTYFARYRDGNGLVVEVPTKCRDESAAR